MVSVWLLAKAMPPEPLTLPVRVTLPLLALVDVRPAVKEILPPMMAIGPAMLVMLPIVMFAVFVTLPNVKPPMLEFKVKFAIGQVKAELKLPPLTG